DVQFRGGAAEELRRLRVYVRRQIVDEVAKQLPDEPATPSRNRKCLLGLTPSFEHVPPVWELRVAEFRLLYDVDEVSQTVNVRAVRHKAPEQTTEDIT